MTLLVAQPAPRRPSANADRRLFETLRRQTTAELEAFVNSGCEDRPKFTMSCDLFAWAKARRS
jgi:hypothetical protein